MGEMHCKIGRITPMPKIMGIRANHANNSKTSNPNATLFFFEIELMEGNKSLEKQLIMDTITSKPKIFRGQTSKQTTKLPQMEFNLIELSIIVCFTITSIGFIICICEYCSLYQFQTLERGTFVRSLQAFFISLPICIVLLLLNIFGYKYYIKKYFQIEISQSNMFDLQFNKINFNLEWHFMHILPRIKPIQSINGQIFAIYTWPHYSY